jgi:exonuclease V gamma subunit
MTVFMDLTALEAVFDSPIEYFLKETAGISLWREEKDESSDVAVFPLKISQDDMRRYVMGRLHASVQGEGAMTQHEANARAEGVLPTGKYADRDLEEMHKLAKDLERLCNDHSVLIENEDSTAVVVQCGKDVVVRGAVHRVQGHPSLISEVKASKTYESVMRHFCVRLMALAAAREKIRYAIAVQRKKDLPNEAIARMVLLEQELGVADAQQFLDRLVPLVEAARRYPMAEFGDTVNMIWHEVSKPNFKAGEKEFGDFVSGGDYAESDERLAFGPKPVYEEIFAPTTRAAAFWPEWLQLDKQIRKEQGKSPAAYLGEHKFPRSKWIVMRSTRNDP